MKRIVQGERKSAESCCASSFDESQMLSHLGPMSSHPAHAPLRLLVWGGVAIAPLIAGLLLLALWLWDGETDPTRFLINHGRAIALYGLSTAGFALGFGLTAFAATVASRSRMLVADNDVKRGPVLLVVSLLFLLGVAAWAIPLCVSASSQTRLLVAWFGLLPISLLMSLATFLPQEDSAGALVRRPLRMWSFVIPAIVVSLVVATRMKVVSEWFEQLSVIQTPLRVLVDAASTSGVSAEAIESIESWVITGLIGVVAGPLLALALAATNFIGRGLRSGSPHSESGQAEKEDWRSGLHSSLGIDDPAEDAAADSGRTDDLISHDTAGPPRHDFFVETSVTQDQAAAFDQIVSLAEESNSSPSLGPARASPSADFIIEGPTGSGRTATIIAAVIHGVMMSGDIAIVLVSQESRREHLIRRFRLAAKSLRIDSFISVGALTADAVSKWAGIHGQIMAEPPSDARIGTSAPADAQTPRTRAIPPRILVGTLEGLEEAFFSSSYGYESLKKTLVSVDTVAIDDLDKFSTQDRLHLPYVLAKLRLILAAEGQSFRTLLTTQLLADAARQLVFRLLLRSASPNRHGMRLNYLPRSAGTSVTTTRLSSDKTSPSSPIDLVAQCARTCHSRGLNVAVVATQLAQAGLTELLSRCRDPISAGVGNSLFVVADLDAIPTLGSSDHALIAPAICDAFRRNAVTVIVAWQPGDSAVAVFYVPREESPAVDTPPKHSLMVLPGKESESLFAQHFSSAARFIPRLQPIPRSVFSALGLPSAGMLASSVAHCRQRPDDVIALVDREILLDPPESRAASIAADPIRWPWCALAGFGDGRPAAARPVAIRGVLPSLTGILADPSGTVVTVLERPSVTAAAQNENSASDMRTLIWRSTDGSEISRDDLAYLHSFYVESEHGLFAPTRIHASLTGPVVIDARPLSAEGPIRQPYMPAFELMDLPLPPGIELKQLLQSAPLAHRVSVFGIVPKPNDSTERSQVTALQPAMLRVVGLYDAAARLAGMQLSTSYEAAKFFVLFDLPEALQSATVLNDLLLLNWGTSKPITHENYPELAAAVTGAMKWQAPGLERLVRCAGFRITRGDDLPLVGLVFVEPRSTESSGFALMEPIVYDLDVMAEFFGRAAAILEQSMRQDDSAAVLYGRAGSAMNATITQGRLSAEPDAIVFAATLLRSIAKQAGIPA